MADSHDSPRLIKPVVPPLMKDSFTRLARPLSQLPKFAKSPCPFRTNHLPQLPPMYDSALAAIITSEPQCEDELGVDVQTWDEEKHTLFSLAQRGYLHFKANIGESTGSCSWTFQRSWGYQGEHPHSRVYEADDRQLLKRY